MQYVKIFKILSRKKVQNSHFNEFKYSLPNLFKLSQQLKIWYDIDQLKRVLIDCWAQLSQDTLIDQLPKRLTMVIKAKGAHVEFRLH